MVAVGVVVAVAVVVGVVVAVAVAVGVAVGVVVVEFCMSELDSEAEKAAEEYATKVHGPVDCFTGSRYITRTAYLAGRADALRWIPVTERLPEDSEYCLVSIGDERRIARELFCADINGGGDFMVSRVTHWMPLPPAPEGEG